MIEIPVTEDVSGVHMTDIDMKCEAATGIIPLKDVPGSKCTTFSIGGRIARWCELDSVDELRLLLSFLDGEGERYRLIGAGSNILIPDEGIADWIVRLGRAFKYCEKAGQSSFVVGAATGLMSLSRALSDDGFSGLEFASGIPGTVGGAIAMNAGAHGSCMADLVSRIRILGPDGEIADLEAKDVAFSYRSCSLPKGSTVLSAHLRLKEADRNDTRERRRLMLEERRSRQPLQYPSAGSVFRNPSPVRPAGRLIEEAGLKGMRVGGAEISTLHANWIINPEKKAKAAEVRELMELCRTRVFENSGLRLEPEIILW